MSETTVKPFIGPRPFDEADSPFFYGRDREVQEILALILSAPVSLIYAKSGIGKTSIFNAKILPELKKGRFKSNVLPVARVKTIGTTEDLTPKSEVSNIYIYNAFQSILEKLDSTKNEQLSKERLENMKLPEFLKEIRILNENLSDEYFFNIKFLIFDQFEEFFNIYTNKRFEQQQDFFYQINECIKDDPNLRIVFIMREEYIAYLDTLSNILPDGFRRKFRLEALRKDPAILAIKNPLLFATSKDPILKNMLSEIDIIKISDTLVENLLKIRIQRYNNKPEVLDGEYVEPVQLQVVCSRLWEQKILTGKIHQGIEDINFDDVDHALIDFYEDAIKGSKDKTKVNEHIIRKWCGEKLITPASTRGIVYYGINSTEGLPNKVVDVLQDKYLIHAEERAGGKWLELTHDRMIKPIKDSNKNYEEKQKKTQLKIIKITLPIIAAICFIIFYNSLPYLETIIAEDQNVKMMINDNVTISLKEKDFKNKFSYHLISFPKNGKLWFKSNGTVYQYNQCSMNANENGINTKIISNNTVVYEPCHRYVGHDSFKYIISNGKKNSNTGIIDIHIKPRNLTAISQSIESIPDKPLVLSLIDWDFPSYNEIRNSGIFPIILKNDGPFHGYISTHINSSKIIYTPYKEYTGSDHFSFCLRNQEDTNSCSENKGSFGYVNITIRSNPQYFAHLIIENGLTQGTIYPLYSTTNIIGRATNNDNPDISITDQTDSFLDRTVSRLHGKIFYINNSFFLQDLLSTNKIIIRDKELEDNERVKIEEGDTFTMGDVRIRFVEDLSNVTRYN